MEQDSSAPEPASASGELTAIPTATPGVATPEAPVTGPAPSRQEQVRTLLSRRPAILLGGAFALGVVLGRLV